jgi:hypothetical protein
MPEPLATEGARRTIGVLSSLWTLRRDARRNNDLVLRQFEDLVRWARDESRDEANALRGLVEELNKDNLFYGSHRVQQEAELHARYAQRWRDRRSEVERRIRDVKYTENIVHWVWRKASFTHWPTNPWRDEIATLATAWERGSARP